MRALSTLLAAIGLLFCLFTGVQAATQHVKSTGATVSRSHMALTRSYPKSATSKKHHRHHKGKHHRTPMHHKSA